MEKIFTIAENSRVVLTCNYKKGTEGTLYFNRINEETGEPYFIIKLDGGKLEIFFEGEFEEVNKRNDTAELVELFKMAQRVVQEADQDALKNPTSENIQVVIVEPQKAPYKKTIPNNLDAMRDIVGGYIEIVRMDAKTQSGAELIITVNEEGKLIGLPFNRNILGFDILAGTFFISAANKQGDNVSIDDITANRLIKQFSSLEVYL